MPTLKPEVIPSRPTPCKGSGAATLILLVLVSLAPAVAKAQRLPTNVHPERYTLTLVPDLTAATFSGSETIEAALAQPSSTITLNAAEIAFKSVTASANGSDETATVSLDAEKEQATFTFPQPLPAGPVTLTIAYSGILNGQLRGFYLSKTAKRNYAVTQFEPTDARRAFPSFDEPALKATFDITLVVDKDDTAISNTNIVSDTPAPDGKHALHFATTPRMSTYLVAFLVGDFKCNDGEADGVPIRSCATPDKVEDGKYALTAAEFVLHYYDTYFGIKYPMPKLDMIALPDFEAGAMENFGAITYRETDLLIDEKTASENSKKNVAEVVAHEMAHQWFGDMVTMQWWNNLWLNEGFATWMEHKPVAAWKPEWKVPEDVAHDLGDTLNLDAQKVTRTIRADASTPDEINEMFDGITYGKAGAVLNMVEHYLGTETFRQGVHNYLAAHMYANATAEDFWNAQTENSHKPVDKIMSSFVVQPGEPLLTFDRANNGKVNISQERFFLNAKDMSGEEQSWTVPVCFKGPNASVPDCPILQTAQQELPTPPSPFFFGDAAGTGYYRTAYDPIDFKRIVSNIEAGLLPTEKITFVGSQFALTRSGEAGIGDYLNLVSAVKMDPSAVLADTIAAALDTARNDIADSATDRARLSRWIRDTYGPEYAELGPSSKTDSPEKRQLRAVLLRVLGKAGDPKVIAEAAELASKHMSDPSSVDAALAGPALEIAAANGSTELFTRLQTVYETSPNSIDQESALRALVAFKDPVLENRALEYVTSGKVRNQDSVRILARALRDPNTRETAWAFIQQSWPRVQAQFTTMSGGYLVDAAGYFCTADRRDEVKSFFSAHKVPASQRALTRAENRINGCIDLRAEQGPRLKAWEASLPPATPTAKGQ